ncbi:uncharacterized protein HKW66_Vig0041660 [Vigna angularis]|uniref:Uncharacterized protein n=1 Tax=Phaseolus angularis TaxID=3914 RepID=A0A8T0KZV9_PHAAN|nr:uncharacterized protein HKW66_Vig0041660 [Vigna angularis]
MAPVLMGLPLLGNEASRLHLWTEQGIEVSFCSLRRLIVRRRSRCSGAFAPALTVKISVCSNPVIDKGVAHESVGVKPTTLVPKEIPVKALDFLLGDSGLLSTLLLVITSDDIFLEGEASGLPEAKPISGISFNILPTDAAGYFHIINQMKELITGVGKKAYTLVMGKPKPTKLANFPEFDCEETYEYVLSNILDTILFMVDGTVGK